MTTSSPTRKVDSPQLVEIPIWGEDFLMRLLGKPMLYIHGKRDIKTWKSILQKLAKSIDKAININLESDGLHTLRLKKFADQLEKATKDKGYSQPEVILALVGIIFELLGATPNYRDRPKINRKTDYALCELRSLHYMQTSFQKMRTIFEASKQTPFCDYHHYDDLFESYVSNFNGNSDGFLQWYKKEYPEVYLQLF